MMLLMFESNTPTTLASTTNRDAATNTKQQQGDDDCWMSSLFQPATTIPLSISSAYCDDNEAVSSCLDWSYLPVRGDVGQRHIFENDSTATTAITATTTTIPSFESSTSRPLPEQPSRDNMITLRNTSSPALPSSTTTAASARKSENSKKVRFAPTLQVRTIPLAIGHHPCCKQGMAVTFASDGADPADEEVDFESFEKSSTKRRHKELHLSYLERRQRLLDATGMSDFELVQQDLALQQEWYEQIVMGMRQQRRRASRKESCKQQQHPALRHVPSFREGISMMQIETSV